MVITNSFVQFLVHNYSYSFVFQRQKSYPYNVIHFKYRVNHYLSYIPHKMQPSLLRQTLQQSHLVTSNFEKRFGFLLGKLKLEYFHTICCGNYCRFQYSRVRSWYFVFSNDIFIYFIFFHKLVLNDRKKERNKEQMY